MSQKDKVLNLFGFLMDLIEEPQETKQVVVEPAKEDNDIKVLINPALPHHPVLNPFTLDSLRKADAAKSAKGVSKLKAAIPRSLELIKKMEGIDKERADELMKTRLVSKATRPFIQELEDLRNKGMIDAVEAKEKEEIETIIDEVGDKLGITLEDGKVKLIEVPSTLRDNIPLDEETTDQPVGVSITKDNKESNELKGMNDLPKEVREKLDNTNPIGKIPQAITRPTEYTPELRNGVISYKPNNKDNNNKDNNE